MKLNLIKFNCVKSTNDSAIKRIRSRKKKKGLLFRFYKQREKEQWEKNGLHKREIYLFQYFLN